MNRSESKIENKLKDEVKKIGGIFVKMTLPNYSGFPDRLCLLPEGRLFFIELKATGKKPRKLQLVVHKKLSRLGFNVLVINSYEQIQNFIDEHNN